MWRGFADGRLTMGHCLDGATLFKSDLHHRVLLYIMGLQRGRLYQLNLTETPTVSPLTLLVRDTTLAVDKHVQKQFS